MQQQLDQAQQSLQNNQLSQDTSALKKELEQQMQQEAQKKKEFADNLAKNQNFQNANNEMLDQGYEMSENQVFAAANKTTGNIESKYQRFLFQHF